MKNYSTFLSRSIYLLSIIFFTSHLFSQNCFDADFESGSIGGYTPFYGEIGGNGVVIFPNQETSPSQHKIMYISDGFDPIAEQFCEENKELLVVGSGKGKYTLRLGDADNGAKTAKVVLALDVTDDISFFLLKYAIVINDPGHDHLVQPRFELNIKDEDGNTLECGQYEVRAAENLDGFESCEDWRIRPWTAAGFELASYLGQTIFIEIISTDCGIGGHAGYAYIDATCSPLELELESYCPGAGFARYVVTEGFDEYAWNTGDSTSYLEINDPIPGQEYIVSVTSSTGCTLELRDTLPSFPMVEDLEESFFNGPDTLQACFGEHISYRPEGTNIGEIEAIELGYSDVEFDIYISEEQLIHFVTKDNLGCAYDTTHLLILVDSLKVDIDLIGSCEGESSGEITIDHYGDDSILTALGNSSFQNQYHYPDLLPGEYQLHFKFGYNCEVTKNLIIIAEETPEIEPINITHAHCDLNNGEIKINSWNSNIEFSINGSSYSYESTWNNLSEGNYTISYRNGPNGCSKEETFYINSYSRPQLQVESIDSSYCNINNGKVQLDAQGGFPPLQYSIDGYSFQNGKIFNDMAPDDYLMIVADEENCRDSLMVTIPESPVALLGPIKIEPAYCDKNNGALEINVVNPEVPFELLINDVVTNSLVNEGLQSGDYRINIIDHNNCEDDFYTNIEQIPLPYFDSISFELQKCGKEKVQTKVYATAYNDSIRYKINDITFDEITFELLPGEYVFSIEDDFGCTVDTLINIQSEKVIWMANIFTPDDDGNNDFFCCPPNHEIDMIEEFNIFDRWGNKVFATTMNPMNSQGVCWDGQFENRFVENGVYVYYIRAKLTNGRVVCKYGDVTVVR